MAGSTRIDPSVTGSLRLDIANALVAIHKELHGHGPTKSQTTLTQDLVVVILEGGYTPAEQRLIEAGRDETVKAGRRAMHDAAGARSIEVIEELTGRKVRSYMTGHDPALGIQTELFVLEPEEARDSQA
jgi:uncharacterized protein YbcI